MYATVNSSDYIQVNVIAGPPTIDVDYYCSYFDTLASALKVLYDTLTTPTSGYLITAGNNPSQVQAISIHNVGPISSIAIAVQFYDGVLTRNLFETTLFAGYTLTYTADGAGWQLYDQNGNRL